MALNIASSAASHNVVKLSKSLPKYPLGFSFCITPWHLTLQLSLKNPDQAGEAQVQVTSVYPSCSVHPISNLVTISKVLERLFLSRLKDHISQCSNFTQFQSAYRHYHSTETAMLKILNDVYNTADGQRSTCLVALDLSAAFDTLDHATIIDRLRHTFGIESSAIDWLTSYLTNRSQFVKFGDFLSTPTHCSIGVPQGSVLGPILFSLFISPVAGVISDFGVSFH